MLLHRKWILIWMSIVSLEFALVWYLYWFLNVTCCFMIQSKVWVVSFSFSFMFQVVHIFCRSPFRLVACWLTNFGINRAIKCRRPAGKYILRNTFWEIRFEKYILRNKFWEIHFEKYILRNTLYIGLFVQLATSYFDKYILRNTSYFLSFFGREQTSF